MQSVYNVFIHLVHYLIQQCPQNIDWQQNMYLSYALWINQQGHGKNPYNLYHISELSLGPSVNQSMSSVSDLWNVAYGQTGVVFYGIGLASDLCIFYFCPYFLLLEMLNTYCMLVKRFTPWEEKTQSSSASQMNLSPVALLKDMKLDIPSKKCVC